mgnify:CR=1 FL=1
MKPVPQSIVLALIFVFIVLGYFAGLNHANRNINELDLNKDREVTIQDFSIALYLVDSIKKELTGNQTVPANVIEDVYPPVPPYSTSN